MNLKTLPIFLTLLFMGVADAMGPLSSAVSANPAMAALMPFFVFIAFAIFSVPGGLLAARIGKKRVLLLGVGTTLLQVAGNPIMRDMSGVGEYGRNLALAQGIKGAGSTASAYLVTAVTSLAFFAAMGWRGTFPTFFGLMALPGVILAGLGFANIWPMLFSITADTRPKCARELSGLMCMAISGGASALAFAIPGACFAYLLFLSLRRQAKITGTP